MDDEIFLRSVEKFVQVIAATGGTRDRLQEFEWGSQGKEQPYGDNTGGDPKALLGRNSLGSAAQQEDLNLLTQAQIEGKGWVKVHRTRGGGKQVQTSFGFAARGGRGRDAVDPYPELSPAFKEVQAIEAELRARWKHMPKQAEWQICGR